MGYLTAIVGPMYSGKSNTGVEILEKQQVADRTVAAFKVKMDNRSRRPQIYTHNGRTIRATRIVTADDIRKKLRKTPASVRLIDEGQFVFGIYELCQEHVRMPGSGLLIVTLLNRDCYGQPFQLQESDKHSGDLMALANEIIHKRAVCTHNGGQRVCAAPADHSQRYFPDGRVDNVFGEVVVVGAGQSDDGRKPFYKAVCDEHFVRPISSTSRNGTSSLEKKSAITS